MANFAKYLSGPLVLVAIGGLLAGSLFLNSGGLGAAETAVEIPAPTLDPADMSGGLQTAVFAGGCFWGVQGVFQHTDGVVNAVSGYAGGSVENPTYKQVTTGTTGHAESVAVRYDPAKISYGKILQVFFSVVHDPTQLNRQGPDVGTHYRSAIYTTTDEQKRVAEAYVGELDAAGVYGAPIVTEIAPLKTFYQAEDYHQDYATLHPTQPYIAYNDLPKIENLKTMFPDIWREEPKLVFESNASGT
jgi:peptide-methionine (S)-S-oxide reductase